MKIIRRRWIAWSLSLVAVYVLAYAMFVEMHDPSIGDDAEPYFRSSFPKLTSKSRGNWNISLYFSQAGLANWIFLPADQIWRSLNHKPRSIIDPSEDYWDEYFEYKIAIGSFERPKAGRPGAGPPATKPADKGPSKVQTLPLTSKEGLR